MTTIKQPLVLAALGLALATAQVRAAEPVHDHPDVEDRSLTLPDGTRVLRESAVFNVPRDTLWRAFATTEGLKSWEAPVVDVDVRVGGHIEVSYDPKVPLGDPRTIRHEVLAFLPDELLVFRNVQAPPGFAHADLFGRVVNILQFEDLGGGRTRLTESGVGYGQGKDWDQLYAFFRTGNAYLFETLKAHFEGSAAPTGPAHEANK